MNGDVLGRLRKRDLGNCEHQLKTDSVCFTAPVLLIPLHHFLHFSAWGLKGRSTEIISQGLAPFRSVNWAETPKPQSLYLHNGNKKETVSQNWKNLPLIKCLAQSWNIESALKYYLLAPMSPGLLLQGPLPTMPSTFCPLSNNFTHLSQSSLKSLPLSGSHL